jgi:hypothetical protein
VALAILSKTSVSFFWDTLYKQVQRQHLSHSNTSSITNSLTPASRHRDSNNKTVTRTQNTQLCEKLVSPLEVDRNQVNQEPNQEPGSVITKPGTNNCEYLKTRNLPVTLNQTRNLRH